MYNGAQAIRRSGRRDWSEANAKVQKESSARRIPAPSQKPASESRTPLATPPCRSGPTTVCTREQACHCPLRANRLAWSIPTVRQEQACALCADGPRCLAVPAHIAMPLVGARARDGNGDQTPRRRVTGQASPKICGGSREQPHMTPGTSPPSPRPSSG